MDASIFSRKRVRPTATAQIVGTRVRRKRSSRKSSPTFGRPSDQVMDDGIPSTVGAALGLKAISVRDPTASVMAISGGR
jgi:hypothetical protein